MVRQFFRVLKMSDKRLPKKVMLWDKKVSEQYNFQTWYKEVKTIFETHNMLNFFGQGSCIPSTITKLKESMQLKQNVELRMKCNEKPKLRTFVTFKDFGPTPMYLLKPISFVQKKFIAQLRLSALPIRIETGRFERPRLAVLERLCPSCDDGQSIENEEHFIFYCSKYSDLRQKWIDQLQKSDEFSDLETSEKFRIIFDKPENIKSSAQFIINIFDLRSKIISKNI